MILQGKVALITGARRVGSLLARELGVKGCAVALTYRSSRAAMEELAESIRQAGGQALTIAADLSQADQSEAAVERAAREFGRLDILVNLASVYRRTPFDQLKPADFQDMIAHNLAAPYYAAVAAARRMRDNVPDAETDLQGKILFFGDGSTDRPYPDYLPYLTAKGGLTTMSLALAAELAPRITVNLIQPGTVLPPDHQSEARTAAIAQASPLKRIGRPEDVVALALCLLQDIDFATASCYRVDGGRFLGVDSLSADLEG